VVEKFQNYESLSTALRSRLNQPITDQTLTVFECTERAYQQLVRQVFVTGNQGLGNNEYFLHRGLYMVEPDTYERKGRYNPVLSLSVRLEDIVGNMNPYFSRGVAHTAERQYEHADRLIRDLNVASAMARSQAPVREDLHLDRYTPISVSAYDVVEMARSAKVVPKLTREAVSASIGLIASAHHEPRKTILYAVFSEQPIEERVFELFRGCELIVLVVNRNLHVVQSTLASAYDRRPVSVNTLPSTLAEYSVAYDSDDDDSADDDDDDDSADDDDDSADDSSTATETQPDIKTRAETENARFSLIEW